MNRRFFLGFALSTTATSVFAAKRRPQARCLRLHHLHTEERLEIDYRTGSYYHRSALARLNEFLKDFRTGEQTPIDPRLFDTLYDLQERLDQDGSLFEILSAYRSPQTNAMLRRKSGGVAKRSLHMSGRALDIRLAETPTPSVCNAALQLSRGGVGYYPRSDFVHLDTGQVRHWGV
ncbi:MULTISPECIES: YcbK family protein [Thiorhodovibrio]|uniref:YcbK family protein n=1 Tax=Thiorhodovibrio TaxID=61593 RepID=UPI0019125C8C|nr:MULTISPECIES: DUF882 domain-containing protein [Thiorhodovibrio]MBK5968725.1 hypothetical protein [Thiorhodovibrio winogradskyi]WPL10919.1 Peptidase M15 [Thiorhodovibrio litoralis]